MKIYRIIAFTLALTIPHASSPAPEEKKGKIGWFEYSQPETNHHLEIISKQSALRGLSIAAGICGLALIKNSLEDKNKDGTPAINVSALTAGLVLTIGSALGIMYSDKIANP